MLLLLMIMGTIRYHRPIHRCPCCKTNKHTSRQCPLSTASIVIDCALVDQILPRQGDVAAAVVHVIPSVAVDVHPQDFGRRRRDLMVDAVAEPLPLRPGIRRANFSPRALAAAAAFHALDDILLPHNIDPMHTEQNMGVVTFATIMDIPDKSRDNVKARVDQEKLCDRPKLNMVPPRGGTKSWKKPKANFVLTSAQRREVLEFTNPASTPGQSWALNNPNPNHNTQDQDLLPGQWRQM